MNLHDLDTPALIVDVDRLEANIGRMRELASRGQKALRPHTKTHKTPEIARMQRDAGAAGITVAKLGEAEAMADAGLDDLLVANQIVGAPKVARLVALARRVRVTVGVDSIASAAPLSEEFARADMRLAVSMEIDTGLGRAGVRTVEEAVALGVMLAGMPGIELTGIFTHEGTVYVADAAERAANAAAAAEKMRHVASALRSAGVPVADVSVGSTPGAVHMAREAGISELRPGVYVLNDAMQVGLGTPLDSCAVSVLATVTSRPEPDVAILDSGTKALSGDKAAEGSRHGTVIEDPGIVFDRANEEHGHLDLSAAMLRPRVGEKLRVVPWHACACVNMHDSMVAVRGEQVEGVWTIAGRGKMA